MDLATLRADTPACENLIHFNNAGAGLMPNPVVEAQIEHLKLEAALGGYEAHAAAQDKVDGAYDAVCRMLNCQREELAMVENATVGLNLGLQSLGLGEGDKILTAEAEYASNAIAYLRLRKISGVEMLVVPSDSTGAMDVEALESMIDDRVKLISITHVPTNGGLINPAEKVGAVARRHGIPFMLDACQSAGQMPLDVEALGCDFLAASGRKFLRGPRGSGFLYVRKEILQELDAPQIDLHGARWTAPDQYEVTPDARRFENWEFNYAAVIGLGVAVNYALDLGLEAIAERAQGLAGLLREELAAVPGVSVHDIGEKKAAIVSYSSTAKPAGEIVAGLRANKINCSSSTPFSTRIDADLRGLPTLVRASPHYYNSEEEVARYAAAVKSLLA